MNYDATQPPESGKPLTRQEVKDEMKRRRGFSFASYGRLIHRHRGTVLRLASGEIGGDLRERFLKFFGFSEEEIPYRGAPDYSRSMKARRRELASVRNGETQLRRTK